jgi:hypothetical protein
MRQPPRSRKTARLSQSIHKQLNMYAFAAGAAGVGMLALAVPAEGRIVYTADNQKVPPDGYLSLDLNHDGVADFLFYNFYTSTSSTLNLSISPENPSNEIFSTGGDHSIFAAALAAGRKIGPHGKFQKLPGEGMADDVDPGGKCEGPWVHAHERYLGLKFMIKGKVHYGWARLNVHCVSPQHAINATVTGYAYESIANKPIIAGDTKGTDDLVEKTAPISLRTPDPKPATLAALALGWRAPSIWRREDSPLGAPAHN